jgi:hypothetical protein
MDRVAKVWVLETHTKGTGANVVPLDPEQADSGGPRAPEPVFVAPRRPPRAPAEAAPAPRAPSRFRIVDLMTEQLLADDVSARDAVAALRDVRSVVDVRVYLWNHHDRRWRLLTHREQRVLWDLRDRAPGPAATGAG